MIKKRIFFNLLIFFGDFSYFGEFRHFIRVNFPSLLPDLDQVRNKISSKLFYKRIYY